MTYTRESTTIASVDVVVVVVVVVDLDESLGGAFHNDAYDHDHVHD